MKVLLIEDEVPAADYLQQLIRTYDPAIQLHGPLESNAAILDWFKKNEPPQLIFSDIELLDGPVFHALERIHVQIPIIFTTAYDQYALDAFRTYGISYLLKPFDAEQLAEAINKFKHFQQTFQKTDHQHLLKVLKNLHPAQSTTYKSKLTIKTGQGMYLLDVKDIACIKTEHGVVYAFKSEGKKFPLSNLLSDLEEKLDPSVFHRINRSEIVNVNFIEKVESYFNDRLAITITGQPKFLISSAAKTAAFRQWLQAL